MDVTSGMIRFRTGTGEFIALLALAQTQILVLAGFPNSLVLMHKTEHHSPVVCVL